MKIGIDCRLAKQTGVGRYTRNLIINLLKLDKKNEYVLFARAEDVSDVKKFVKNDIKIVTSNIPWHGFAEQFEFPKVLNRENLDLVHFPYFSVPVFYYKPFVVTIHDLIVNRFATGRASTLPYPVYFAKRMGYQAVIASAVYRSTKIIVPSKTVKADLLKSYRNVNPSKVEVTYEGPIENSSKTKTKPRVEGKYFLRVGNFYPHKNVENLIAAFKDFIFDSYDNKDARLVLVGKKDYFWNKISNVISRSNIENNIVFIDNPSDQDLTALYENAVATIVPSFMEGFSLTAVEAMFCGSLLVASDIPVHREICGDSAIYFNPKDTNDMRQKIGFAFSLVESSREDLIIQAKKQSEKFSWSKMAQETLNIYESSVVATSK